jgi:hypothetical protein
MVLINALRPQVAGAEIPGRRWHTQPVLALPVWFLHQLDAGSMHKQLQTGGTTTWLGIGTVAWVPLVAELEPEHVETTNLTTEHLTKEQPLRCAEHVLCGWAVQMVMTSQ